MNRRLLLPAVYAADQLAGDPEWLPHPVRLMGWGITKGESLLRPSNQNERGDLLTGAFLTVAMVTTSYFMTRSIIAAAYRLSNPLGSVIEIILGWTCLAARNLQDEAKVVLSTLETSGIPLARRRLARIVGRDTENLDAHEINRAIIETLAESASDGIIAPLFYMSVGGVPLAMAYKTVNTLDSMIGHADARYFYFGKVAARLDDVANLVPARLTALAIVVGAWLSGTEAGDAARIWLRDGYKHKSPNAGQPESAMAGALGVRLGGGNFYESEFIPAESMGDEFPPPSAKDMRKAIRIVSVVTLLGLGAGMLLSGLFQTRRSK